MGTIPFVLAAALAPLGAGCGKPTVLMNERPTGATDGGAAAGPRGGTEPGVPGFALPGDAGTPATDGGVGSGPPPGAPMTCASETHEAKPVPVDLMLLVDTSGSMYEVAGGQTKWLLAQNALNMFVRDPRSAGLGIGLQFFPIGGEDRPCRDDGDCATSLDQMPGAGTCAPKSVCTTNGQPTYRNRLCNPTALEANEICPFGGTCTPLGRCAGSGGFCYQVGQPCPGGGGMCSARPTICRNIGTGSCNLSDYERPAVPIAQLPAAEPTISAAMTAAEPIGATPTAQAVEGTLNYLRQHLAANPGRRGVLVLLTDGVPFGDCGTSEAPVRLQILAAQQATPSISTYVIGVFGNQAPNAILNGWARVGGTDAAVVLTPNEDLTRRLLDTLNQIRGQALPCEFTIPPQTGAIDYNKVNVRVTGAGGAPQDLLYTGSADRCDPASGGWYYDVDPTSARPSRVIICPASCTRIKATTATRLDLLFGCATRVIQ